MAFIRENVPLNWFVGFSHIYAFPLEEDKVEDWGEDYEETTDLLELVGRLIVRATRDVDFATKIVVLLAYRTGTQMYLRTEGEDVFFDTRLTHKWKEWVEGGKQGVIG